MRSSSAGRGTWKAAPTRGAKARRGGSDGPRFHPGDDAARRGPVGMLVRPIAAARGWLVLGVCFALPIYFLMGRGPSRDGIPYQEFGCLVAIPSGYQSER